MSASPGAAVGKAVFDSRPRGEWSRSGEKVILVRRETNPDDLDGMIAAEGILTARGGKTCHAAVVARGMGKTCVCGAEELNVDAAAPVDRAGRHGDRRGRRDLDRRVDRRVVTRARPVMASPVVDYFEGSLDAACRRRRDEADPTWSGPSTG